MVHLLDLVTAKVVHHDKNLPLLLDLAPVVYSLLYPDLLINRFLQKLLQLILFLQVLDDFRVTTFLHQMKFPFGGSFIIRIVNTLAKAFLYLHLDNVQEFVLVPQMYLMLFLIFNDLLLLILLLLPLDDSL